MPERIQRKRTKGWRMPEGAVYVGRPTRWGNPITQWVVRKMWDPEHRLPAPTPSDLRAEAVRSFRECITELVADPEITYPNPEELRGVDLACWCPLDQPCHADVLLEIANTPAPVRAADATNEGEAG